MIVAVIAVRMMEVAEDEVVEVVGVRDGLVSAALSVGVSGLMTVA